ncbi:ferric reductase NAD binding domain-containing protein [Polychytrium aggregatum]|uniref:ferric reductase NAD binding domain-containing protein n=1 Tax=Polychytrium aggregatum TaxID=110093 RepID=UPI0022FE220C|nr:ferric reductase NAD binding domain-containing protein [Polychytrium aggregatum]KAI9206972.1 ferric reductase NAD binding domain-containing protein [Polychytrium aggregatum]
MSSKTQSVYYQRSDLDHKHQVDLPFEIPVGRVKKSRLRVKIENWLVNTGPTQIWLVAWVLAQIAYFAVSYYQLWTSPTVATFRSILGHGLPIARGAANIINFNCALILLTVCRNAITRLRATFLGKIVPFDHNIDSHIYIAWSIVLWSYVHCVGHYFNYLNVNKVLQQYATPEALTLLSGPGLTGQIITVALFLMVTSAMETIRRKAFELFWFTHHLFVVFFGGTLVHGAFCFIKGDIGDPCRGGPTFWKWWIGPAALYLLERIIREWRGRRLTQISKVIQHPSKVVELQIKKPSCKTRAGQYIFLNCPEVAYYEWHPFTLTSSPHEDFVSVHIRVVGDWTTAFAQRLGCQFDKKSGTVVTAPTTLPVVMIDGPFGTASEDVFNYDVSVLVGAGIGVTPFASILKTIWYRLNHSSVKKLKKVHFIWICRDKDAFEWFTDLLSTLEEEYLEFLEIQTYLTASLKPEEMTNLMINTNKDADGLTGLRSKTFYGRPNLDQLFKNFKIKHPSTDIGVFFCGPPVLSDQLHKMCDKWTDAEFGTRFYYGKENF